MGRESGPPEFVRAAGKAAPGLNATAAGLDAVQTAAGAVTDSHDATAGGINAVRTAADGAQSSLVSLAARISGLSAMGLPGGAKGGAAPSTAPAGGGGAAPAPSAAPGKQGSYAPPPRSSAPIQVTLTTNFDGRRVAQSVTRHQVAANDTRNGTGTFDSNRLKTPIGYSGTTQA